MSESTGHTAHTERRMSRGVLKRQPIVEDSATSSRYKRQNTLTVYPTSPSCNDEAVSTSMARPLSGLSLSAPAKSPTRLSPNQNPEINMSKSEDRLSGSIEKAAARWRGTSSFERSDSHASTSVRVSGRRPRASAFRLGATSSVSSSPRNESLSLSRDSGSKSPHFSPRTKTKKEKSLSVNSSDGSDRKSVHITFQTSSEMSAESPSAMHRTTGPIATLVRTNAKEEVATTPVESPQKKFNNYQIMAVKKGLPDIIARDPQGKKYSIIHRELTISPLCLFQRNNKEARKKPSAWIFTIFTVFVCTIFPTMSYSSDIAFYITCSSHYNHIAELLVNVTAIRVPKAAATFKFQEESHLNEAGHVLAASPIKTYIISTVQATPTVFPPAPLMSRDRIQVFDDATNLVSPPEMNTTKSNATSLDIFTTKEDSITVPESTESQSVQINRMNETVCASPADIIAYMRTGEAANNLEQYRHVALDIFKPVFILGSFPCFILGMLSRIVVIVTGHRHFISAYFMHLICLPLQLATGSLAVYSATYQLGEKEFSCWTCAVNGDCSNMHAFSWLEEKVTKALIASLITKFLDGIAGGIVIFVVFMRVMWRKTSHTTVWWYAFRCLGTIVIFVACLAVGTLLILTPALLVIKFEFLRLVTKFPGYDVAWLTAVVLAVTGSSVWVLFAFILIVFLICKCFVYCRIKEH